MHVLMVVAHPRSRSLTHSITQAFTAGLAAAGHTHELADLYAEGFRPVAGEDEVTAWEHNEVPAEIAQEQARLRRAQGLALAYPLWWATPPAILQGWIQRVLTQGFAFEYGQWPAGRLRHRAQLLVNVGSRDTGLYGRYIEPIVGVLNYCGIADVRTEVNWGVAPAVSEAQVMAYRETAYAAGTRF